MGEVALLRASGRVVVVDTTGVSGAQVLGNATQLARAVRNLLDNAAQHGGLNVAITLSEESGQAELRVTDDGAVIPVQLQEQVFERFARVDQARAAIQGFDGQRFNGRGANRRGVSRTGGSGLGLAIARELIEAHGGIIMVDSDHSPGAHFVVRLPLNR